LTDVQNAVRTRFLDECNVLLFISVPALQDLATSFSLIGKMAVSGSFAIIYNFTAELYPTLVRSVKIGVVSWRYPSNGM